MAVVSDCEWMMKSLWICSRVPQARLQARPFFRVSHSFLIIFSDLKSFRRRKPGQDASHFKTDEETGKMIIDESESDADDLPVTEGIAGTACRETLTSVDGFTRGPNGRIKFNKDTKKRRREEDAMDVDVEPDEMSPGKRKKMKDQPKFGHEYKAKVGNGFT